MRQIEIEGSWNVRDLGGYPSEGGRSTRWRVLVRAGNLDKVTPVGQQALLDYGIRTIVDLRAPEEVEQYPDVFAKSTHVVYRHLPILRNGYANGYVSLGRLYTGYLDTYPEEVGKIISAVSESEPGTLLHCHAGKDRTGIVTALLLGAVGVPDEVIAEDYALTSAKIAHLIAEWREHAQKHGSDMERFEHDVSADAATMLATLEHLRHRYGGVTEYLRICGVPVEDLQQLTERLLE
jgi:protein-tyrosine phosphatase